MDPRALLDELMGADRNMSAVEKQSRAERGLTSWSSASTCRLFLAGFCPNHAFESTRMALPPCALEHSTAVQADFQRSASKADRLAVRAELLRCLERLEEDGRARVRRARERLEETARAAMRDPQVVAAADRLEAAKTEVDDLLVQAEAAGEKGEVDLVEEVRALAPPARGRAARTGAD